MLYEALGAIAGPFFKFTIVKMKGPNKPFNDKKCIMHNTNSLIRHVIFGVSLNVANNRLRLYDFGYLLTSLRGRDENIINNGHQQH